MDFSKIDKWNNGMYFEEHKVYVSDLIRYAEITGYIVFNIKLGENFRQKARSWVYGHKKEAPLVMTYNTVIS